ncbi:MAG: Ni/Fe hydrogenase subunit alpha [Candidatus Aminicenantes bacterium]|nr:Ni/Fe hydrogenase subunit alpha [Candidatus Aminicenantes bacterium]
MKTITIDPITRLEGHGKISIFLDDAGNVADAYLQVPELRGFEKFCVGRPVEEMPRITTRICGVCPEAHMMAAAKACDAVYHVELPRTAKMLRELLYVIFYVTDHATHFYALGGPDFVLGPEAPPAQRNILGVVHKVGVEIGRKVIGMRGACHELIKMMGGKAVHPIGALPGGMSKGLSKEERDEVLKIGEEAVEFGKFSIGVFNQIVLGNKEYVDLILSDSFTHRTYNMGLVDEKNHVNFYDGRVRVTGPDGAERAKFAAADYLEHIVEHVEPWSYLKFPFLRKVGWKGLVDGPESGIYKATPLSRLNVSEGMATPLADEEHDRLYKTLGGKPVHQTLATHWARLVELLYAAERWVELASDPEIVGPDYRVVPDRTPDEGMGVVEAPRGTLFHHYKTDKNGILQEANLIVGTTNNNAAINLSVKKAAMGFIKNGEVREGLLNIVEMAFRAYDPCFGCATHAWPGQAALHVRIFGPAGDLVHDLRR